MAKHDNKIRIPDRRTTVPEVNSHSPPIEAARVITSSLPGSPCEVSIFGFHKVGSDPGVDSYAHHTAADIAVHDPFWCNCAIVDEIICCQWNAERHRYHFVDSTGLLRKALVVSVAAGSGDTFIATCTLDQDSKLEIEVETDIEIPTGIKIWVKYLPGESSTPIYAGTITGRTVEPIKTGKWVMLSTADAGTEDPDTPFRHTIGASASDNPVRAGSIFAPNFAGAISYTDLPIGIQSNRLIPQAVVNGTVAFFNEEFGELPAGPDIAIKAFHGGITRAIVYVLDEDHEYACVDGHGVYTEGIDKMCLISIPYGPYRICSKEPLIEDEEYPQFCRCVVKEQVCERSIGYTRCIGVTNTKFLEFSTWVKQDDSDSEYRFQLSEIESESGGYGFERLQAVENAPQQLYMCDVWLHGVADRRDQAEEVFTFTTSDGTKPYRQLDARTATLKAEGKKWDNTWEAIDSTQFYLPGETGVLIGYQTFFTRLVVFWTEKHKAIRFRIIDGDVNVNYENDAGANTIGGLIIHRLGDRGAGWANGIRSLAGFSIPEVGGEEPARTFAYPGLFSNDGHTPSGGNNWHIDGTTGVLSPYNIDPVVSGYASFGNTFTLHTGNLPPYASLDASNGAIYTTGITPLASPTTGSFVIKLVDGDGVIGYSPSTLWEYVNE